MFTFIVLQNRELHTGMVMKIPRAGGWGEVNFGEEI